VVVQHVEVSQVGQAVIAEARNPMRKGRSEGSSKADGRSEPGQEPVRAVSADVPADFSYREYRKYPPNHQKVPRF
jgi:hypothetical protein